VHVLIHVRLTSVPSLPRLRGFEEAEHAYRAALDLRPKDYEARLGLALALRGQLDAKNKERLLPEIEKQRELARKAAPGRGEAQANQMPPAF
jgi:cytochrome c-type biogenesis protein CcmH/NrfG